MYWKQQAADAPTPAVCEVVPRKPAAHFQEKLTLAPCERCSFKMNGNIVPDFRTDNEPPYNKVRIFLLCFAVCLSILGVVAYMTTGNVGVVLALNAPLLVVMAFYFPKKGQQR